MVSHVQSMLAEAARALLDGRPNEARTRYEACATEVPSLAALGLAVTAWLQGDFRSLRGHLGRAAEAGTSGLGAADAHIPRGLVWALEGLAMIHAGELGEGLARQAKGLEEARRADDGAALNAMVAIADALVFLGRWTEARATLAGVRPELGPDTPIAGAVVDRLVLALATLTGAPDAGDLAMGAVRAARERGDEGGLAVALRWQGAWLAGRRPAEAVPALEEAVALAARTGQHLVAAEALTALAGLGPAAGRVDRLAAARMHARASGSLLTELAVAAGLGGEEGRDAARRLEQVLAPLPRADREAFLAWPGRGRPPAAAGIEAAALGRLGGVLTAITAQPDLRGVLQAALAAFVEVAGAERGFLLRLSGFEVLDQVIHGAAPDSFSTSLAERVVWTGEPLVVADLETDAELGGAASIREMGLRTALGMPLRADGEVIGVILADSREVHPGFDAETLAVARAIADHVVAAMRAAAAAERHREGEAAEAVLARAALAAAGAKTLAEALPAIAVEAGAYLEAERIFVHLGPDLACHAALDREGRPLADARASQGAVEWVAAHGQPLIVLDTEADGALAGRPSLRELALRAIHAAPIPGGGVLYLDSRVPAPPRGTARRVLEGLAAIVGRVAERSPPALGRGQA